MNPFSTRYYLRQNKTRISKIIFMISMISLVYVGGLYLTNISEETMAVKRALKDYVEIRKTFDDIDGEQIKELEQEFMSLDYIDAFAIRYNFYQYKTMLGFSNGDRACVFSKEDFIRFNEKRQIISSDAEISNNTILLSEKQARYLKVKNGDMYWDDDKINIHYGEEPFNVITFPSKAFSVFFITEDSSNIDAYLITCKNGSNENEFYKKIEELRNKYDKVYFETYYDSMDKLQSFFEINNIIYFSIIGIISIVFAITINAVFVGLYDRRKQEFAFYRGIGIHKKLIYKKITSEILSMNVIGLIIGTGISILAVTLLNEFIYHKDGLSMWYYHPTALFAVIICDLAIIIPVIGLRLLNISKEARDVNFL